jgi:hypothetical protein
MSWDSKEDVMGGYTRLVGKVGDPGPLRRAPAAGRPSGACEGAGWS